MSDLGLTSEQRGLARIYCGSISHGTVEFARVSADQHVVRTIDAQIGHWIRDAQHQYSIDTFPKKLYRKMLMGGRAFMREHDPKTARAFVFRQMSKRWQYLNAERIEEFISEEYGR